MIRAFVLFALVSQPAVAGNSDHESPVIMVEVMDALEQGNAGDRKGAIRSLDKVLADIPGHVDARVGRGINRYLLGDSAGAREDLSFAFNTQAWQEIEVDVENLAETTRTIFTVDLVENRRVGAAMLVMLDAREGQVDDGRAVLKRARDVFGDNPQLFAAEARLMLAADDSARAWEAMAKAVAQPDGTLFVQSVASEMVAEDPDNAIPEVTKWLQRVGQWTVHYNQAIGHFEGRRWRDCTTAVQAGLEGFPSNQKMLQLGYTCAARTDLAQAQVWLDQVGGPKAADPWSVLAHAEKLHATNHSNEALALLVKLPKKLPGELPAQRERVSLEIYLAGHRLDEALRVSKGDNPLAEANLGYAFIQAERWTDAEKLLTDVCPKLLGEAGESSCKQMLKYAQEKSGK
ncbi:MAG: hypothetical protein GWP91_01485 [Rhodobacterales bacterium]|nr:hypothetical protein [Rhodobacterales bacterium]